MRLPMLIDHPDSAAGPGRALRTYECPNVAKKIHRRLLRTWFNGTYSALSTVSLLHTHSLSPRAVNIGRLMRSGSLLVLTEYSKDYYTEHSQL
jgi:hypothetical protein